MLFVSIKCYISNRVRRRCNYISERARGGYLACGGSGRVPGFLISALLPCRFRAPGPYISVSSPRLPHLGCLSRGRRTIAAATNASGPLRAHVATSRNRAPGPHPHRAHSGAARRRRESAPAPAGASGAGLVLRGIGRPFLHRQRGITPPVALRWPAQPTRTQSASPSARIPPARPGRRCRPIRKRPARRSQAPYP